METTMPTVSPTAGGGGAGGDDGGGIATFRIRLELMATAAEVPAASGHRQWELFGEAIGNNQRTRGTTSAKLCLAATRALAPSQPIQQRGGRSPPR